MAHFYGEVVGNRGSATMIGSKQIGRCKHWCIHDAYRLKLDPDKE